MLSQVLLFLLLAHMALAFKVLVYNTKFGFSHVNFMGSLADSLALAGYNVTVLQPLLNPAIAASGSAFAKVIPVEIGQKATETMKTRRERLNLLWKINNRDPRGVVAHAPFISKGFDLAMKSVLNNKQLMEELRQENFDVAIGEMFDYGGFPIFYELGIKTICGAHSTILTERTSHALGAPFLPSFVPTFQTGSGDDGSFFSRLNNLVFSHFSGEFERILESQAQKYMEENHPGAPSIHEMVGNFAFIFTNSEPLLDFPRPTFSKVIDLGGIGLKKAKPLTEEWDAILSIRSKNVLISFGSIAPSEMMPDSYKQGVLTIIRRFPEVTFIWKYENPDDGIGLNSTNLFLSKWTPQTDLLASGKVSLFVTHGGAGSIMETASSGVPVIAIPLFGDQLRNALMAERFGFARIVHKFKIEDADELEKEVRFGLEDGNLREMAEKARNLIASRPFSPQEKLVKHVELAVKFGNIPSMAPSARNFSTVQYYNLDIFAILALSIVFLSVLIVFTLRFILNRVFHRKNKME